MPSLEKIKSVIKKIASTSNLGSHICFFGGSMPYIYHNQESNREHSDIDVLVDIEYLPVIRQLLQENNLYDPTLDSLNLGLDQDYGLKVFIDGVYVEFEPMTITNGIVSRSSFSPNKELAGTEYIPYINIEDMIIPIEIDGVKTFAQSPELIKASKEQYKRPKDIQDIAFIDKYGINQEKYSRVSESIKNTTIIMHSYEEQRKNKNKRH